MRSVQPVEVEQIEFGEQQVARLADFGEITVRIADDQFDFVLHRSPSGLRLPPPPRSRRPARRCYKSTPHVLVDPGILAAEKPGLAVWSSPWPSRPDDQARFALTASGEGGTLLRFTLLTTGEAPDRSKTGYLRRRLDQLLFADLRFSYGQ